MYVPPHYREDRRDILLGAIAARSFGTLITAGSSGIRTSHVPFGVQEEAGQVVLLTHLARSNPQWRDVTQEGELVACFLVDDAYISPGWYPTKAETGRVVPTWNYVAVEARGRAVLVEQAPALLDLLGRLTEHHEHGRPKPWSVEDAPPDFTEALLRGIVGVKLHVSELTGAWKLDQKKRDIDRNGAAAGLSREASGKGIARRMAHGDA